MVGAFAGIGILARRWTLSNLLTRDVRDVKRLYLSGKFIDPFIIKILVPDHPHAVFVDLPLLFRLHREPTRTLLYLGTML